MDMEKIDQHNATNEVSGLEEKIKELRSAYWEGKCDTPDSEYDALVEKLRKIDPNNGLLATPEHGASHGAKIVHKTPMLSLQKVYSKEDLMRWIDSVSRSDDEEFLVQPKYDGISCHYDHGTWSTRGDGNVGEDVSEVCRRLAVIDQNVPCNDFYGEIVIRNSHFDSTYRNVRRENGETFKTQRNAVAGILNTDDVGFYAKQNAVLTLVDYDMYSFSMKKSEAETKWDIIRGIINALDYPMDGIVVKIADKEWYGRQGVTSHHPKGAMAFKFENSSQKTFLKDVEWGMGKECITATAIFQPVVLNGVTVSRAVIPMKSKSLPCVMNGDFNYDAIVTVERAGDVIPHITEVSKNPVGEPFAIDKCPFCGSEIEILESGVRCTNPDCRRKKIHRLYDALVVLGMKNVGESTVTALCNQLGFDDCDISLLHWMRSFTTPQAVNAISRLNGFGDSSANEIVGETRRIGNTTMSKFIAALGIPNVGISIGKAIEQKYGNIVSFLNKVNVEDLRSIDGIGDVMACRIVDWLAQDGNSTYIANLASHFTFDEQGMRTQQPTGKTVCFTGAMRMKRSEMQFVARQHGYSPIDSVTKGLDILVVADDVDMTSSKCVKAKKYGTEVIRESDFLKMCDA